MFFYQAAEGHRILCRFTTAEQLCTVSLGSEVTEFGYLHIRSIVWYTVHTYRDFVFIVW